MASDIIADGGNSGGGSSDGAEAMARLSQMSARTSLMVIEATLRAVPKTDSGYDQAHAEVRDIARRMVRATEDFVATLAPTR